MGDTGHRDSRDCLTQGKSLHISELHMLLYKMRTPAQVSSRGLPALKLSARSFMDKGGLDWEPRCECRFGFEGAEKEGGVATGKEGGGRTQAPAEVCAGTCGRKALRGRVGLTTGRPECGTDV